MAGKAKMSPLQIEIVMHYYCCTDDYRGADFSAPAVRESIDWMRGDGGLLEESNRSTVNYQLTERGRVYVEALQSVPLPIQTWAIPDVA